MKTDIETPVFNPRCKLPKVLTVRNVARRMFGVQKVSTLIRYMLDDLEQESKRKDFEVRMYDFGGSNGRVCWGCAATCALTQLGAVPLKPKGECSSATDRENLLFGTSLLRQQTGWEMIECFFDCLRCNPLRALRMEYKAAGAWLTKHPLEDPAWPVHMGMATSTWRDQLPAWRKLEQHLREAGF